MPHCGADNLPVCEGGGRLNQSQSSSSVNETEVKRAWQAPTIEELDFRATEAAYIPGAPNDLGIYSI